MIELPEALVITKQINETITGKKIVNVIAEASPHKYAWFLGDPQNYKQILTGKTIDKAINYGGMVEIKAGSAALVFGDGVNLKYHIKNEDRPQKHQLLLELDDASALSASVQMYGGLWCFENSNFDNVYYKVAKEKPSPLTEQFNEIYFGQLLTAPEHQKLGAKAFLATGQRIPGLGNGVLQDILWNAKINPKRKVNTFSDDNKKVIFKTIKTTLTQMVQLGGRDTEKDLFGKNGGYKTIMSKNNAGLPCPACGEIIKKESYLGGSIYFCPGCQPV